jgi:hypothetical protein
MLPFTMTTVIAVVFASDVSDYVSPQPGLKLAIPDHIGAGC